MKTFLIFAFATIIAVLAASFLLKPPAQTSSPESIRYVKLMEEDAEITVYSAPDLASESLGPLGTSAKFFEVISSENGFYQLNYGERMGWVIASAFEPYTPEFYADTNLPKYLRCYGEEPFWDAAITDGEAEFTFIDQAPEIYKSQALEKEADERYSFVFEDGNKLTIKDELCRSTMTDNTLNWSVEFQGYAGSVSGCCTIQR